MRLIRSVAGDIEVRVIEAAGAYGVTLSRNGRALVVSAQLLPALLEELGRAAEAIRERKANDPRPAGGREWMGWDSYPPG